MLGRLASNRTPQIADRARAAAILLLTPMTAAAQDVTEPALKAAFIYNFAKFTEWPADAMATGAPLVLCVLGDAAIGEALERAVKGRTLAGHSIGVSQAAPDGRPLEGCHIAYVSGVTASQAAKVVAGLRDAPVLTISDVEGFTQHGRHRAVLFRARPAALRRPARVCQARSTPDQLETAGVGQNQDDRFHHHPRGRARRHARAVRLRIGPIAAARSEPRGADEAGRRAGLWRLRAASAVDRGASLGVLHHRGGDQAVWLPHVWPTF